MIIKVVIRILIKSVIIIFKQKLVVINVWMPIFILSSYEGAFSDDLGKLRKLFKYKKIKEKKIDL